MSSARRATSGAANSPKFGTSTEYRTVPSCPLAPAGIGLPCTRCTPLSSWLTFPASTDFPIGAPVMETGGSSTTAHLRGACAIDRARIRIGVGVGRVGRPSDAYPRSA